MNASSIRNTDVLIVGAGPTGLVLALWLMRLGVRVRIVDKTAGPGTTSRALAVQARTLELYMQIGVAGAVVARGRKMTTINLWRSGQHVAHVVFGDMGADLSPFPYALIYPQDEHERLVIEWMRIEVERVHWFSTYRVHHRVADHFRKGRAFLLGDAAHIHSPVGGQGMNTGIGDAVNLAWKIADVVRGRADPSLLDSYDPERIGFARRLVATTDQAFKAVTSDGAIAR